MFRNMVTSLLKHERIRTTDPKAKELRKWADHVITLAKRGDLHARRQALAIVREKGIVHKLFENASERFGNRAGGYTRIIKLGRRPGDAAPISIIELVSFVEKPKEDKKKKAKKTGEETKQAVIAEKSDVPAAPAEAGELSESKEDSAKKSGDE